MSVTRFDIGSLRRPEKLPNGFLRVDAYLTRTGIFEYRNPDGSVRRELRNGNEVFSQDALKSFVMAPVTDDHPTEPVTLENIRTYQRGHLGDTIRRDGDMLAASMLITDKDLIEKMSAGKHQVSCGYVCDMDETPGEYRGIKYDAVQTNIRGNHVAVVDVGRAGPDIRVRMDSGTYIKEKRMLFKIDGIDFEMDTAAAQAVEKSIAAKDAAIATAKAETAKETAKADALTAELASAKTALEAATDPALVAAKVSARVALEKTAGEILGADVKTDAMSDKDIKLAVVAKLSAEVPADKRDNPVYVDARYDGAIAGRGNTGLDAVRTAAVTAQRTDIAPTPASAAKAKYMENLRNAYKSNEGGAVKQ